MSFRFNLGDFVIPRNQKLVGIELVKIEAFHLNGFMKVRAISTNMWYLVKDEDFELFAETKTV